MYLGCVEDEDAYCGEDGCFCNVFDNEDVKRRKPTIVRYFIRQIYQNVLREKIVGSQIDNSHACPFPPSSANVGVAGRKVCLELDMLHRTLRQRRKESR
jgi:hypothetical protein